MADNSKLLTVEIISPDRVFYQGTADFVELCTTEGELGVYRGHIPLTSILAPGVLKLHTDDTVKTAALHDGFVEIFPDRICIMAESCEWPDEIDLNRANAAKERAEQRLRSTGEDINIQRAELALRRALVRIELGHK